MEDLLITYPSEHALISHYTGSEVIDRHSMILTTHHLGC